MPLHSTIKHTLIGLAGGYAGLLAMDRVTTVLEGRESEADKRQEKRVSMGVAFDIAAEDLARRAGMPLEKEEAKTVGSLFHTGLGLGAGVLYVMLRRLLGMNPPISAVAVGGILFLGVDEGLNTVMGWSAPPSSYPAATHLRAATGHLTLGVVAAIGIEVLDRAMA